jgi:peptide/nickel transport system permease protein
MRFLFNYIIRRLFQTVIILFGVSIVIFSLIHLQPGNPYSSMMDPSISQEVVEQMLTKLGYYDPLPVQYFKWISRAIQGDFGFSIQYKQPVIDVIASKLGNTFLLSFCALTMTVLIAIPAGVFSATKQYSFFDYFVTFVAFIGISIPAFFFGLLLIKWFAVDLKALPISGMITVGKNYTGMARVIDIAKHLVLPTVVLGLLETATLMRYTRSSMLEVKNQDYIRTARAKGVSERRVNFVHALRNALIPVITILSMQIPFLFSGALLTETIFVWPGIGRLNYEAVLSRDYPLIMGILMMLAIIILLSNFLADILYAFVDPRIKYE